jgi:hypothetical protein
MIPQEKPPIAKILPIDDDGNVGYIAVYRTLFSKGWYRKSEYVHLWLHLLMKATHKGKETWFDSQTLKLKPGQIVTGRKKLARETGINESKVERILKCFEIEQQIEQVSCSTSRLISISNWTKYQSGEQAFKQRVNSGRTAGEQRVNTKQECNNDNNEKNDIAVAAQPKTKTFKTLSEEDFKTELEIFKEIYDTDLLNAFHRHWSEKSPAGKMKFQLEKTWETSKRLRTWYNNGLKFKR